MIEKYILVWLLVLTSLNCSLSLEPISTAIASGVIALTSSLFYDKTPCRVMECCDERSVSMNDKNVSSFGAVLNKHVYGQPIMQDIVRRALIGHLRASNPSKALVLSFHGPPGTGKSYVSQFIAQSFFVRGMESNFVKKYVASNEFSDPDQTKNYKEKLAEEVKTVVKKCERALFIFDDVNRMSPGVFDSLVPYMDHHDAVDGVDFRKAIFILLSNTGSLLITKTYTELWRQGKRREKITMKDFDKILREGAFNEEGGLQKSHTIESSLIDHYIPFLPLEEEHIRQCIHSEFRKFGYYSPNEDDVKEILAEMTFLPKDLQLFSTTGCKRIAAKVAALVEKYSMETFS